MKDYSQKNVESRKARLIEKYIPSCGKLLDLGCGPGEYGPILKKKCKVLVGLDSDAKSLKIASERLYDILVNLTITNHLNFKREEFDTVWCSELLEHMPNLNIVREIERVTKKIIIITMPNPLSPHFKEDKTHILNYDVPALKRFFKNRPNWTYRIQGMSIENVPLSKVIRKITSFLCFFPSISPTIVIIGERVTYANR